MVRPVSAHQRLEDGVHCLLHISLLALQEQVQVVFVLFLEAGLDDVESVTVLAHLDLRVGHELLDLPYVIFETLAVA